MKTKRSIFIIIAALILIVGIEMTALFILFRKRTAEMIEVMVYDWKAGNIGSVGEDFREVPAEILAKMRPESKDSELQDLVDLYSYKGNSEADSDGKEDLQVLSDEEYRELMETQYPASYEADPAAKEEDTGESYGSWYGKDIIEAVESRIKVDYKMPAFIFYPLEVEFSVTAPSVNDAYLNAGKNCESAAQAKNAMVDYIRSGKAATITETRSVKLYKSGERLYADPEPDLANVLIGGYGEFMLQLLSEYEAEGEK